MATWSQSLFSFYIADSLTPSSVQLRRRNNNVGTRSQDRKIREHEREVNIYVVQQLAADINVYSHTLHEDFCRILRGSTDPLSKYTKEHLHSVPHTMYLCCYKRQQEKQHR